MSYRTLRTLSRVATIFGFLIIALPAAWWLGPSIEGRAWPVIEDATRGVIERDGVHVCWSTSMHKIRVGVPAYALYTATYDGLPVSITVYLRNKGTLLTQRGFANHAPGERWITDYCTDLPLPLVGKPLTIEGTLFYELPWRPRGWRVPQPLPTLRLD